MVIQSCSSIVVVFVTLVVGKISKDESREYMVEEQGGKFFFTTSKKVVNQLQQGEQITIVCEPTHDFAYAKRVFFISRKNGLRTEDLLGNSSDWPTRI